MAGRYLITIDAKLNFWISASYPRFLWTHKRKKCLRDDNMCVESGQAETKCFRKIKDCLDRNLRHARPSDEQYVKIRTSSTWNVVRYRVPSVWKHVWPRTEWTIGDRDCKILPPRTKLTWQTIVIGKGSCSKRPLQCWCKSPNLLNMIFLQHWKGRACKHPNLSSIPKPIVLKWFPSSG